MINLLPYSRQKEIKKEESAKIAAIVGLIIAAALLVFLALLFLIMIFYQYQLRTSEILLSEKMALMKIHNVESVEKQIAGNNALVSKMKDFYGKQTKATAAFLQMSECLPSTISLTNFSFAAGRATVGGLSPDRSALELFKRNLEQRSVFSNIVFPVSSWLDARDIEFSVNFQYESK